jgi:non-ribosomal peptide synthase protein (TIGR01720 family)
VSQLSYWGVSSSALPHSNTTTESFVLSREVTSALLGSCNDTLQTRPQELMVAGLIHSFAEVFRDRSPPAVFNEIHGREPWDDSIDLSRTVGWFTSMFPVRVSSSTRGSLLDVIREMKDCMCSFKHNGRSYFASRFVDGDATNRFVSVFPAEITFNYVGIYQQLERDGSLFKSLPVPDGCNPASAGEAGQFSLFTVSVVVEEGCAKVAVTYSPVAKRQEQIHDWVRQYETALTEMSSLLLDRRPEWTLSDFSLAFDSYNDLDRFQNVTLAELGVRPDDVEDVYPCSPTQEGMLVSQIKDPSIYRTSSIFRALFTRGTQVDCNRLQQAWKAVVRRHPLLRTLLVGNVPGSSGITNVVLKDPPPSISFLKTGGDTVTLELVRAHHDPVAHQANGLQHHLSVYQVENEDAYLCLDINHAIIDIHSVCVMLRDLQTAYSSDLD